MIFAYITLGVLVWFVCLGLASGTNTVADQRGRHCFEVLFLSSILYISYEVIQWLIH